MVLVSMPKNVIILPTHIILDAPEHQLRLKLCQHNRLMTIANANAMFIVQGLPHNCASMWLIRTYFIDLYMELWVEQVEGCDGHNTYAFQTFVWHKQWIPQFLLATIEGFTSALLHVLCYTSSYAYMMPCCCMVTNHIGSQFSLIGDLTLSLICAVVIRNKNFLLQKSCYTM